MTRVGGQITTTKDINLKSVSAWHLITIQCNSFVFAASQPFIYRQRIHYQCFTSTAPLRSCPDGLEARMVHLDWVRVCREETGRDGTGEGIIDNSALDLNLYMDGSNWIEGFSLSLSLFLPLPLHNHNNIPVAKYCTLFSLFRSPMKATTSGMVSYRV